jgi:hypothetical protein
MKKIKTFMFRSRVAYVVNSIKKLPKVPGNVYCIRHFDNDWDWPMSIEPSVLVNRYGFLVLDRPIKVSRDKPMHLTEKEQATIHNNLDANL